MIYLSSSLAITALLGGFAPGAESGASGLGGFSFNLNAFFNPQGWSCIFPNLPLYYDWQYEGFNYLGAGFIFLLLLMLLTFACNPTARTILKKTKIIVVTISFSLISSIVAITHVVTIGDKLIIQYPVHEFILKIWGIFRTTGRIAWIAVYVIEMRTLIILAKFFNKKMGHQSLCSPWLNNFSSY